MNQTLREIAALTSRDLSKLTHQQRVTRLYRHSLKALLSWVVDREVFYEESDKLRARFDAVTGPDAGRAALRAGEAELYEKQHPDPWVINYMPGGTKFMRNPPPHPVFVYGEDNIPEEAVTGTNTPVWPDQVPISFRPEMDGGLVDFASKTMK